MNFKRFLFGTATLCWVASYSAKQVSAQIQWTYTVEDPVPSFSNFGLGDAYGWVNHLVNDDAMVGFEIPGDGKPFAFIPLPHYPLNDSGISAAKDADIVINLYQTPDFLHHIIAHTASTGELLWEYDFPKQFLFSGPRVWKVSRDGSIVAVLLNEPIAAQRPATLFIFSGLTGKVLHTIELSSAVGSTGNSVDLSDDGSLCLAGVITDAILIDTATGLETFRTTTNGNGWFKMSGAGETIAVGGFGVFEIYQKIDDTYQQTLYFEAPGERFTQGAAVARDGLTVGVTTLLPPSFLITTTRLFDAATGDLLGTYITEGTGIRQDVPTWAVFSADGSRFVVSTWGTQNNDHPEVMVFDRDVNLIDSLDTRGSANFVDITDDGHYVFVANKSVHANVSGRGGDVHLYYVP